jgi:gentisate 1,2-dioxygenase
MQFNKHMISPKDNNIIQAIHAHIVGYGPGAVSQKHGHMNGAVMYVLEGKGHDVHDGVRYDWQAGDAVLVHNACVHQHFNDEKTRPARVVVFKAKPLISFLNLYLQKTVSLPKNEPLPGFEDFTMSD